MCYFSDNSVKCSGYLNQLNQNSEISEDLVYIPVPVENRLITNSAGFGDSNTINFSYCPFSTLNQEDDCLLTGGYSQISDTESLVSRTYSFFDNTALFVSSLKKIYKFNYDNLSFELYNNLYVDQISTNGYFVIQNNRLYINKSIPLIIRLY